MGKQHALLDIQYPKIFENWDKPYRYKVAYGGRGSGKTWQIARKLLLKSLEGKIFVVCAREIQNSIQESVKRVLENQIDTLGLDSKFIVQKNKIIAKRTKSEFIFVGLRHNIDNIKGIEGADIVWIEEADKTSEDSWTTLVPTVRKNGSEIWLSFNPKFSDSVVYEALVKNTPDNALVLFVNWWDNPWFPDALREHRKELMKTHPMLAAHVYDGELLTSVSDAIFKNEMFKYFDVPPRFDKLRIYGDTAQSTEETAAYTVLLLAAKLNNDIYILDIVRGRYDPDDLLSTTMAFWDKHANYKGVNAPPDLMRIENKSSGIGLNYQIEKRGIPIDFIKRSGRPIDDYDFVTWGSKWERAQRAAFSMTTEGGNIYLPLRPTEYSDGYWVSDFKEEVMSACVNADNIGMWDQTDSLADAINDLINYNDDAFFINAINHQG